MVPKPKALARAPPKDVVTDQLTQLLLSRLQERERAAPRTRASTAQSASAGGWLCKWKDCPAAEKHRVTFASKGTCFGCGRAKNKALSPPLASRVPPREPTARRLQPDGDAQKNRPDSFAAAVKAGGPKKTTAENGNVPANAAAQTAGEPGPIGELFGNVVAVKEAVAPLIAGGDETVRLGITPLKAIDASCLYRLPPSDVPAFSVEAELAKVAPVEQAEAIALKDKYLSLTLQAAAQLPDGHPSKEGLLKDAEELKTAITKLKKKRLPGTHSWSSSSSLHDNNTSATLPCWRNGRRRGATRRRSRRSSKSASSTR